MAFLRYEAAIRALKITTIAAVLVTIASVIVDKRGPIWVEQYSTLRLPWYVRHAILFSKVWCAGAWLPLSLVFFFFVFVWLAERTRQRQRAANPKD